MTYKGIIQHLLHIVFQDEEEEEKGNWKHHEDWSSIRASAQCYIASSHVVSRLSVPPKVVYPLILSYNTK